ncbi:MAG: hypothetical protein D6722_06130 [Bacteroidetes bacterium]|nr:MAG: hypothetical protein D6722_06130 [Bacteroidota bacterium]
MRYFSLFIALLLMGLSGLQAQALIITQANRSIQSDSVFRIQAGTLTYVRNRSLHDIPARDIKYVDLADRQIHFSDTGEPIILMKPQITRWFLSPATPGRRHARSPD